MVDIVGMKPESERATDSPRWRLLLASRPAILLSPLRLLDATLRPYIVAFQCLPKVAIAPIIIMWFGYDITSKVVMVTLLTFFPLLVNSMAGFHSVDLDRIELLRSLSATRWQIFW